MSRVEALDVGWLLLCAALVLLMQAGFTAVESGLVRSKNSINVAVKNFASFLIAASVFWLFGFGLMFGADEAGLIGTSSFLFDSDSAFRVAFFVFQIGFVGAATTLMSGAVAERMRFGGYLILATFLAAIAYPVYGHWAWGDGGWLRELGFVDFAGSTVVHSVGGWVALAAIVILGPRIGRFGPGARPIRADYLPLTTVGVFMLWIGWYGFNGGSRFALDSGVPAVILNTTIAAAFGGIVGYALSWRFDRRPDVVMMMNASLAGLVAITAAADVVSPWRAAVIGGVGAVVMRLVASGLERREIDDAVGAVPVHLAAGIWGTLAVGVLGDVSSFPVASGRVEQIGIQLVGIGVACAWAFGVGFTVLALINRRSPFRVDREGELVGLNVAEHGASTALFDLLSDMDVHRRSGNLARPVRVESHTEVGQIASEYNRVVDAMRHRTDALQLLRRTAAAANESTSAEDALALAIDEVGAFTGWPIGHAFLVSRDDPETLVSTGIWRLRDAERDGRFRTATERVHFHAGRGLPGIALQTRRPVFGSSGDRPDETGVSVFSLEEAAGGSSGPVAVRLDGLPPGRAAEWAELGLRAGLAIPVMAGDAVVAVLEFFADEPFSVDAELLDLLLGVGTQLGRVVERQRSEEARLRALVDNMPASVYLRDLRGRFILVNREYEEFWGIRQDQIRGRTLAEVDTEHDLDPAAHAAIDRTVLAGGEPRRGEYQVVRAGREHVIADVRFPVLDSSGRTVAVAGIDIDVTAQKRSEAELAELLRRVEMARDAAMEAASAKTRFLANVSHELRTPMNAIIGFTRLVTRNADGLAPRQVDNLAKILASAERLLTLIDEILDLSRVDAGQVSLDITALDISELVHDVAESLEPLVERPRVRLAVDADPDLPALATDRDKLRQILLNLVSNAINYPDEGSIVIRAEAVEERLRVAVSDTGIGIRPDELDKIFLEFHRAAPADARGGTGLGLAISQRLARALGGAITVESRIGRGSTFTLDLPLRPAR